MRVVAIKILRVFWEKHNDSEQQLKTWYKESSKASWTNPSEIKSEYSKALKRLYEIFHAPIDSDYTYVNLSRLATGMHV